MLGVGATAIVYAGVDVAAAQRHQRRVALKMSEAYEYVTTVAKSTTTTTTTRFQPDERKIKRAFEREAAAFTRIAVVAKKLPPPPPTATITAAGAVRRVLTLIDHFEYVLNSTVDQRQRINDGQRTRHTTTVVRAVMVLVFERMAIDGEAYIVGVGRRQRCSFLRQAPGTRLLNLSSLSLNCCCSYCNKL